MVIGLLILTEGLHIRFAVGIKEVLAALLPGLFKFWCRDVPVRPALFGNGSQILAEIFQSGSAQNQ